MADSIFDNIAVMVGWMDVVVTALLTLVHATSASPSTAQRPHLVFLLADDQVWPCTCS